MEKSKFGDTTGKSTTKVAVVETAAEAGVEAKDKKINFFGIFKEVSGASDSTIKEAKKFFDNLGILPKDPFEAAKAIRAYMIQNGFRYNVKIFRLQDMIKHKSGNCLGLSLLIGSMLQERGFEPKFQIVLNPKDTVYKEELKLLKELVESGGAENFSYDNPVLPSPKQQAQDPQYRFVPLEHPALLLSGKRFETTSLEDTEEDPSYSPDAELVSDVGFREVASNVYIDTAKAKINSGKYTTKEIQHLLNEGIQMWDENREGWAIIWDVANTIGNKKLSEVAKNKYISFRGKDSRFHYTLYKMTRNGEHLKRALEAFPAYIFAFFEKNVVNEKNLRNARFNFAVAAWCIANSGILNLKKFYEHNRDELIRCFGEDKYNELMAS